MMLGTHACLPVIGVATVDIIRLSTGRERILSNWQLFFIGFAGILPDVSWPHFSLVSRLSSPTHTIWFLIALLPIIYLISKRPFPKNYLVFSLLFVASTALHIFVDAISGGVSFFYPIEKVWAMRLIPYPYWFMADGIFIVITSIAVSIRYWVERKKVIVLNAQSDQNDHLNKINQQ